MTKEHILEEIRRVAATNHGRPPGRAAFYKATGLNENDWSGKYWSRWSDAVREAGFSPNQMTVGYEQKFLLEKVIELAREIGRFPVSRELKLKAFKEKGFPSSKTFESHFGSKSQLISKVVEYCEQDSSFEDILRMCKAVLPHGKQDQLRKDEAESVEKIGIVYLIKSGKFYKIGKTNSIGRRVYDLAIQLAEKPTTVHVIKTDDPDGIEAYWHERFKPKRLNGEWFNLSASEIKAFKRWLRIV
jgi:hypothetical protein